MSGQANGSSSASGELPAKWLYVAVPLLLWSSHAVLSRILLINGRGAFEILFLRSFGAILFGVLIIRSNPFSNFKVLKSTPGIFCVLNFICFNMALKYLSGYLVMVLESSCFVFSILYAVCAREKIWISKTAVALYALGLGLLYWNAAGQHNANLTLGLFWGILTSVTFGIFNATVHKDAGGAPKLYALMIPCLLFSFPIAAYDCILNPPSMKSLLLSTVVLGGLFTGAAYHLWGKASQCFTGIRLSELFLLTLPGTFLVEMLFLNVKVNSQELGASAILILATGVNIWKTSKRDMR